MSAPAHRHEPAARIDDGDTGHGGHSGWLMLLCCIPMIVAVALIALGR